MSQTRPGKSTSELLPYKLTSQKDWGIFRCVFLPPSPCLALPGAFRRPLLGLRGLVRVCHDLCCFLLSYQCFKNGRRRDCQGRRLFAALYGTSETKAVVSLVRHGFVWVALRCITRKQSVSFWRKLSQWVRRGAVENLRNQVSMF